MANTSKNNEDKIVLGLTEDVAINKQVKKKIIKARIDTGAITSSIDKELCERLKIGPVIKTTTVISSHGRTKRPSVIINVTLKGKTIEGRFTVADRSHMKYKLLIGQNILKQGFLIDPSIE